MTALIIDIGSSSVRALLFDDRAQLIPGAVVSQVHTFTTTPAGAATLDAAQVRAHVESCLDTLLQHPAAQNIRVVGMATLAGNMMGIDAAGNALTPIYTYADTRSAEDVDVLKDVLDEESIHQRTGCLLHTAYQPGRLRWLMRAVPALSDQVARWVDLGTYLYTAWFGDAPCSYSIASWSGMLNRATLEWNARILEALNMDTSRLPALADVGDMRQGLIGGYADRWPALRDVPFCLAVGDGAAANIGSGCADASRVALTVGTTAALRAVSNDILPRVPEGLWGYRVDAPHHLIGGATSEGGNIFHWARSTLRLGDEESLETELMRAVPDGHGLTFLPLLAGERSPGWAAQATGAIHGLRLSTTPLDLLQAALEGVALRLALIYEQLEQVVPSDAQVIAGGGALYASPAWTHIIANALNRPLYITQEAEITARGTAILAYYALGLCNLTDFPPAVTSVVEPIPAVAAALLEARERQLELYDRLIAE
ncbi:MAG: gluconokinase [Anaerolineae bacterium]|nr:gluconokinase [Anaerolineae bacterium]